MTATTFEQWWELMEREPLTYEYEHAKEGWNAAIKNMEPAATSHNTQIIPCQIPNCKDEATVHLCELHWNDLPL